MILFKRNFLVSITKCMYCLISYLNSKALTTLIMLHLLFISFFRFNVLRIIMSNSFDWSKFQLFLCSIHLTLILNLGRDFLQTRLVGNAKPSYQATHTCIYFSIFKKKNYLPPEIIVANPLNNDDVCLNGAQVLGCITNSL